jgi:hypothetical protein
MANRRLSVGYNIAPGNRVGGRAGAKRSDDEMRTSRCCYPRHQAGQSDEPLFVEGRVGWARLQSRLQSLASLRFPTIGREPEVDSRIDYAHSHPLTALANELRIERRTIENRPYCVLRFLLALLPFTAIALVGPLVVSRDLALTVASALLGVQLAGPYARWSAGVIRLLRNARDERRHPVGLLGTKTRSRLDRRVISMRISFIRVEGGFLIKSPTTKGMSHVRARLVFRSRLEPSWRRYFLDYDARLITEGIPLGPNSGQLQRDLVDSRGDTQVVQERCHSHSRKGWPDATQGDAEG